MIGQQKPETIQAACRFQGNFIYPHDALKGLNGPFLAMGRFL
jgi:hypothetical protein